MQELLRIKPPGFKTSFSRAGVMWLLNVIVGEVDYYFNKPLCHSGYFPPQLYVGHNEFWENGKRLI